MFPDISMLTMSYCHGLYLFMLQYGYLYQISLVLAIIIYFHAMLRGGEPALTWAFITFALPIVGALLYLIYFLCSWKNLCVSRKEREKAREIVKKWEDTEISEKNDARDSENREPYRRR